MDNPIKVAVAGARGRMGLEVVIAVHEAVGLELVAAIDRSQVGDDIGEIAGIGNIGVAIQTDLQSALESSKPDVVVDFTLPVSAMDNIRTALKSGVRPVVGTTGITVENENEVRELCSKTDIPCIIAPNFAIGAILLMEFAKQAAKYMPDVEIIEMHHEKKLDSPSGTALMTARKISEGRINRPIPAPQNLVEKIPGGRGAELDSTHIHSVRLPGFVASQAVIFGGPGQTLTLRHDSLDRKSFMPGVVLAVRKVMETEGLIVGLENLL